VFWYRGNFEPKMEISESFIEHAFIYLNLVRKCKMVLTVAIMLEGVCSGSRVVLQTARLGADEPVSRAIILASQADKSATSSEPLEPCLKWPKTQSW
jgi:hypothetical protein